MTSLNAIRQRRATMAGVALSLGARHARAAEIDRLYEEHGWTLEQIGTHFGISRERVRQIRHVRGKKNDTRLHTARTAATLSFWAAIREPATFTVAEARRRAVEVSGLSDRTVGELVRTLQPRDALAIGRLFRCRRRRELIRALKQLGAAVRRTPTAIDLNTEGRAYGLNLDMVQTVFGSLKAGQAAAGFTPNHSGRPRRHH